MEQKDNKHKAVKKITGPMTKGSRPMTKTGICFMKRWMLWIMAFRQPVLYLIKG